MRVLTLGTGYRDIEIDAGDWGLIQAARPVVAALMDTSVGSTAFLLRQLLGRRVVRVSMPLEEDYTLDDAGMVDRLDDLAVNYAERGLEAIPQPDHTIENLRD